MRSRKVLLIGAPTDVGAGQRGGSMGPESLRVADIGPALIRLGHDVCDKGNLSGPPNPGAEVTNGYRHLEEVVAWCGTARDAVYASLVDDRLPILLGGDHSLAIGSSAGISRYCEERSKSLSVLWLDAHADYNTPDSTRSGNIHGMPVAVITGHGPPELIALGSKTPMVESTQIIALGVRSVDHGEQTLVRQQGLTIVDMREIDERGMRTVMNEVLAKLAALDGHLHVSLDVDFLDPTFAPGVATTVAGGPTYREAQLCMEMIYDSGLMGSLDIMELNPAYDDHNKTAELVVDLVESLFGQQILSRHNSTL